MRRLIVLALFVALAMPLAAQAKGTVTKITFEDDVLLCNGDTVHLSGPLLIVDTITTTPSGGEIVTFRAGPQGIAGTDLATGIVYHATGVTRDSSITSPPGGFTETFINRFHIQATRGAESFIVTETFHVTITPTGAVTASIDKLSATC